MLPKNLVLDEVRSPENFDALQELLDAGYRVTCAVHGQVFSSPARTSGC